MTKPTIRGIALLLACLNQGSATDWTPVPVPGEQSFSGYAWYRTWVKPHEQFFVEHERDLWGESVILNIRGLAGAHEVYVNGKRIGSGGRFRPSSRTVGRGTIGTRFLPARWWPGSVTRWRCGSTTPPARAAS